MSSQNTSPASDVEPVYQVVLCVDVKIMMKLLMVLQGSIHNKAFALEVFTLMERYLDGDTTMCQEIHENKRLGGDAARGLFTSKVMSRAALMVPEQDDLSGFVYGMVSDAFPNLVKIGYTHNLARRLAQANTFCAPCPFRIIAQVRSMNAREDESMAHGFFAPHREAGEIFRVSEASVRVFFNTYLLPKYNEESRLAFSTNE